MGRRKKYNTDDERKAAQRKWSNEYYHRNKHITDVKNLKKYYEQKIKEFSEKLSNLQ